MRAEHDADQYIDRQAVAAEIAAARKLCGKHNWPIIDVTRRSIEETAAEVMALLGRPPAAVGELGMDAHMPLWLAARPLVLASKSAARRALLEAAGIPIEIEPADIDERAVEARAGLEDAGGGRGAAGAGEGARRWRRKHPGRMVLGADQTLALGERRFSKAADRAGAREQLAALRGKTHTLHSAVAVVAAGTVMFEHVDAAQLTMRAFSDGFLDALSRCRRRRGDRERRRLSARRRRACNCSSASRAIISPCSACRCCRCSTGCGGRAIWRSRA